VKPNENTLCPKKCAESLFSQFGDDDDKNTWKKVCYYVDSILQDIPVVPKAVRNVTDLAICAIGSLIPDSDLVADRVAKQFQPSINAASKANHNKHCPSDCSGNSIEACDKLESLLEDVNSGERVIIPDFVMDIVGKALCFPKDDAKPDENTLCPDTCGHTENHEFSRLCYYVDSILQSIPHVSHDTRYLTDHAICAFGDLMPDTSTVLRENAEKKRSEKHNRHCPSNCDEGLVGVCDNLENVLDEFKFIPELALDIVGKSVCFPSQNGKPSEKSLCPQQCGQDKDEKNRLVRVCNYVDTILQSIPSLPTGIRNKTDHAICLLSNLESLPLITESMYYEQAQGKLEKKHNKQHDKHCPSNCGDNFVEMCDNLEGTLENVKWVPEFVLDIVGKGVCFPKKGVKPNEKTLCPKECGQGKGQTYLRLCYYVDNILQSTPFVLPSVRNLTDHAICALADVIPPPKSTTSLGCGNLMAVEI